MPAKPPQAKPRKSLNDSAFVIAPYAVLLTMLAFWPRPSHTAKKAQAKRPGAPADELSEAAMTTPRQAARREPRRGRDAKGPIQVPAPGWKDIVWRTWREVGADRLPSVAASVTFYGLLAIFPALGAFVSLYGLVANVDDVREQLQQLGHVLPSQVVQLLADQMTRLTQGHEAKLSVALGISVLVSVWSANAGMSALFDGLNIAYGETEKRNFFKRRLITLSFTLGLVFLVTASAWILIGIPNWARTIGLGALEPGLIMLRWVAMLALIVGAFAVVFRYGPSRQRARWRWVRWGAATAAIGWLGGSLVFSWYVNTLAHYDATYGPLGAIIVFMVWLWYSTMAILVGAELNAEIEHQTAVDSTTGAPLPMGARGAAMADTVGKPFRYTFADLGKRIMGFTHRTPPAAKTKPAPNPS
jgi:membrane protein